MAHSASDVFASSVNMAIVFLTTLSTRAIPMQLKISNVLFFLAGLFLFNVAQASDAPQGISDVQWQNIKQSILKDKALATVTEVKITADDGSAHDRFGETIAVDGTRMAVGAYYADINGNQNQGAVYVYDFDGANWRQTAKITAVDGMTNTRFGYRVSIDNNRLAVLADNIDNGQQKTLYVYEFGGIGWTQVAKLTSSDVFDIAYCRAISLSGERLAMGCYRTDVDQHGAAYVFESDGGSVWSETAKITPNGGGGYKFGVAIALSGSRLAVGSNSVTSGSAYVFERNNSGQWDQLVKIPQPASASTRGFGMSVALLNDRLAVGPYIFELDSNSGSWTEKAVIGDGAFPLSAKVSLQENRLLLGQGAYPGDPGEANLFRLRGVSWQHVSRFVAFDQTAAASFASSIALSETHVAVGGYLTEINGNLNQGAVYLFDYNSSASHKSWLESEKVENDGGLSGGRFDLVSMSENRMVIGASDASINGNRDQGAVYIYDFDGSNWNKTIKLFDVTGAAGDHFGYSVSLSGDRLAISSSPTDSNPAVYLYHFDGSAWNNIQKIIFDTMSSAHRHGVVSLDENRMAVGFYGKSINGNSNQGTVYIYDFDNSHWSLSAMLTAADGTENDLFGRSVSLSGDRVAVGATSVAVSGNPYQGAVYIFSLDRGNWSQTAKLTASDGEAHTWFGSFVSLENDRLAAAALHADPLKAYVFEYNGAAWNEKTGLVIFDAEAYDQISSISLSKNRVAIGTETATIDGDYRQGAAYIYQVKNNAWNFVTKLTASDGEGGDLFGHSVSLYGNRVAVKSGGSGMVPGVGIVITIDQGAVYIYVDDLIFGSDFD